MKNNEYSRRKFISKCLGAGSSFLGGALILISCGSKKQGEEVKKEASSKNACDDLSDVSKSELEKRQKLAYVDKSPVQEKYCGNCGLFVPGQDKDCGGCLLFKGPVYASGYCIQHTPKV